MKLSSVKTPIMCLVLALLASFIYTNVKIATAEAEDFKIGVVDIGGVFEKYKKRLDLDQKLKEQEKEFQDEINKKRKELIDLDEETQLLDLGSESRGKNENLLERKNVELEGYAKFAERQLLKKYKDFFESIYQEVVLKIEEIGKQDNFDLIIKKEEPELKSGQISDLQFKIGIRTVLYHSESVNITSDVIDNLNASYAKEKARE
ncbi:MAG: OmpH family outer membrane protein [Candidatus Scalindua sp.]|jgi:Skp family chaperone for outer membrane proteins|nr:OmpH family outer membrane protein [Candidatus Scalindua sp.]MBT5304578.1 OmpH family outer membrane protein [Candidatus Scalindua sp.]MBT6045465.1 OmpH family outer membrane protein [Candidatus Scalindua sp.]MBT6226249.1 OmpH family outer membrane protein [Candidatus Scalindua sp.]MBT6561293.1 OmpH family outer membrane protein [Candidatus Scalindua sp.]